MATPKFFYLGFPFMLLSLVLCSARRPLADTANDKVKTDHPPDLGFHLGHGGIDFSSALNPGSGSGTGSGGGGAGGGGGEDFHTGLGGGYGLPNPPLAVPPPPGNGEPCSRIRIPPPLLIHGGPIHHKPYGFAIEINDQKYIPLNGPTKRIAIRTPPPSPKAPKQQPSNNIGDQRTPPPSPKAPKQQPSSNIGDQRTPPPSPKAPKQQPSNNIDHQRTPPPSPRAPKQQPSNNIDDQRTPPPSPKAPKEQPSNKINGEPMPTPPIYVALH